MARLSIIAISSVHVVLLLYNAIGQWLTFSTEMTPTMKRSLQTQLMKKSKQCSYVFIPLLSKLLLVSARPS